MDLFPIIGPSSGTMGSLGGSKDTHQKCLAHKCYDSPQLQAQNGPLTADWTGGGLFAVMRQEIEQAQLQSFLKDIPT